MKTMVVMGEYPAGKKNGASKPCSNASYQERIYTVAGAPCPLVSLMRHDRATFFSRVISLGLETPTRLADPLGAQLRFVQHLNHDAFRVGAIKGRATVTMDFERIDDLHTFRVEFLL